MLDEQLKIVNSSSGFEPVGADGEFKIFVKTGLPISQNGYLYVYTSNESPVDVFFDNLQVSHVRGPLLEETNYYPFGLVMQGISFKSAGKIENNDKYNGNELQSKEFSDGSGLEWTDYGMRNYDQQIGRWHVPDPLASLVPGITPYRYGYNNPILYKDLFGLLEDWYQNENGEIVFDANVKSQKDLNNAGVSGTYLGETGTAINEQTGATIVYNKDGTTTEVNPQLQEVIVTSSSRSSSSSAPAQADWLSASNMLSYAGGGQSIYENGIFSRNKFDYQPSAGPNAGRWTPIWKTDKAGEFVRSINALPEEGYLVLKNSKNAVAKYNLGKTVSRAGKVLGALGMVATIADGLDGSKGGWKSHHTADLIIGAAMTFGPVGWIGGLTFLAADLITQGVTGKSITENLFDPKL